MKLYKILLTLAAALSLQTATAQFTALSNTAAVQQTLAATATKTQTISSDFTQVKNMKMLNDKVSSKGKFYFKQNDKVRIEYTQPFQYLLVMSGGMIMVKENGKVSKINTRNSLTMQSVNRVMMDCMRGTVFNNKDFSVKALASSTQYLLKLSPVNTAMKGLFKNIDVYLNKADNNVSKLVMTENNGDYTEMIFSNKKINTALADALFSVR
ncbi:outer membrane lipoprotein carrier protein LolA [Taibaiella sp. KBW10]|uniref:outer membrane lipoprotein carrier protein LolA n=1 Tax=Taibaiella sp. KBW10 TaxID=2153357 RepID=UPI000F5B1E49|nr:outer membrane lipoprotein carrier protein LolA [Taibaiella sp. KBW10]RQO31604.1 outer membrane lipoprotein carrier protein LolA [Taibaiella sp. KBW10]